MKTKIFLFAAFCLLIFTRLFSQANTEFTSTLIAKKGIKNRTQLFVASQSYGSSYAIYGEFSLGRSSSKGVKFKELIIHLKNYRTNLFMGIDTVVINDENKDGVVTSIDVYVKANMGETTRSKDVIPAITGEKQYFLKKGETIEINRYIMPMDYQKISQTEYNTLKPKNRFKNKLGLFKIAPWDTDQKIFDSEFFFMDGLKDVRRKANYDRNDDTRQPYDKSPGFRCKSGVVVVM